MMKASQQPAGAAGNRGARKRTRSSLSPALRRMRKETGMGLPLLTSLKRDHPGDPFRQLVKFFGAFRVPAATGRKRHVSWRTEKRYLDVMKQVLQTLRDELNMRLQNLTELSTKHVAAVTRNWEARGLSAPYLAFLNTALRRFGIWMGKPDLAPLLSELLADPARAQRHTSLTCPKTWESRGIDPEAVFRAMDKECEVTGVQLRLAWTFGLRVEEQLMFKPEEAHKGDVLIISRGAKGGRVREVEILSPLEAELIERAKVLAAAHLHKVLGTLPPRRLAQARHHYYYLCRKIGLKAKGRFPSTPHGARHSFTARRYALRAGVEAPVFGGAMASPADDHATRLRLALELGHGRASATTAYIGTVRNMSALARKGEQRLLDLEALLGTDGELVALTHRARVTTFCLVDPVATGGNAGSVAALMFESAVPIPDELLQAICRRASCLLSRPCVRVFRPADGIGDIPIIEVRALGFRGGGWEGH